jgi:hypothetical protein
MDRMKSTRNIITDDVTVDVVAASIIVEYLRVILRNICTLRVILYTCRKIT